MGCSKKRFACICAILAIFAAMRSLAGRAEVPSGTTVFRHVNVVTMLDDKILANRALVVRDGKIVEIADDGGIKVVAGAQVIDGSGGYLLPGLADMHVHSDFSDFPLFLMNGITTIREMNGTSNHLKWRQQILAGEILGPRLSVSSPLLAGEKQRFRHVLLTDPAEADKAVRSFASQGYDYAKVYDGLSSEVYQQILKAAREVQIPAIGHIPHSITLSQAIAAGQIDIEHANQVALAMGTGHNPLTPEQISDAVRQIVSAGVRVTPTLASLEALFRSRTAWYSAQLAKPEMKYEDADTLSWWRSLDAPGKADTEQAFATPQGRAIFEGFQALTKALASGGALLLAGTDTPNPLMVPGFSLHEELRNLHAAGLSNFQVLRTATANPADFLKLTNESGTIAAGKRADMVLVQGNPLDNLDTLRTPVGIMLSGKWISRTDLEKMLAPH